jgi:hypothetical protein
VRRRGRRPRRRLSSSAPAPRCRLLVPGWLASSFPRCGAAAFPSPSLPAQAEVKEWRKPQWGWWPGIRDSPAWRLLKRGRGQPGVICPQCPWPFAGLGRWHPWPPLELRLGCARCGGNRVIAYPVADSDPDAHAPALGVRAAPSRALAWCGSFDQPLGRGEDDGDEGG